MVTNLVQTNLVHILNYLKSLRLNVSATSVMGETQKNILRVTVGQQTRVEMRTTHCTTFNMLINI